MHTRFTSLVSGLTLSVLLAGPVFAQTPVDAVNNDQELIQSCQQTNVPVYHSSLDAALLALRGSMIDQWKRQVTFRVNAATKTRRAAVQNALRQAGAQLDVAFTQFVNTQNSGLNKDVNVAVDSYVRLDSQAEDAALARWSDRSVSFQALDAAFARAERSLRLYATIRDRATLSRVWNSTRKQAEDAFAQSRDEARQQFVQDMDDCIAGVKADDYSEEPVVEEKKVDEKKVDDTSSKSMSFMVTSVNLDTVSDYASVCAQKVMARAHIYTNGIGRTSGYFLFHDGIRSPEIVADTDAMGHTYAQFQREFSSASGSFTNGNVKYIITSPNAFESNRADFKIQCQNSTTPQPSNTPTSSDTKADVRLLVDGKSEVNTCGTYRYTFNGTITYGAAGTVKYYWLRSDGGSTIPETVMFEGPGTKTVRTTWDLGMTYAGWIRLVIISPNMTQSQADFNLIEACSDSSKTITPPVSTKSDADSSSSSASSEKMSAVVGIVSKQDASVCGAYRFQFQGNITTDSAGKIVYRWERSDGVLSPEQTIAAEKAGTYATSESWDLSGTSYAGWVRLHVLSPSDMSSNQAAFTLTQACK